MTDISFNFSALFSLHTFKKGGRGSEKKMQFAKLLPVSKGQLAMKNNKINYEVIQAATHTRQARKHCRNMAKYTKM